MLLQIFYLALDKRNKDIVDNVSGISFINSSYGIVSKVLDQVAIWWKGWDIKDAEVAPSPSFMCSDRKDEEEKTEANTSKVMSCLELLLDHMLGNSM